MNSKTTIGLILASLLTCLVLPACSDGQDELRTRLQQEVDRWRGKYETLTEETQKLQRQLHDLEAEKNRLEGEAQRADELAQQLSAKSERVEKLQQDLADLRAQLAGLKKPEEPSESSAPPIKRVRERLAVLGADLFRRGDYNAAFPVLLSAHDLGEPGPAVLYRLAFCQGKFGEMRQAAGYYEQCYAALQDRAEPDESLLKKCLNNWGIVLAASGQFEKAAEKYTELIQTDRAFAPTYFNLGLLYADKLQEPQKAVEAFRMHVAHGGERLVSAKRQIEALQAGLEDEPD